MDPHGKLRALVDLAEALGITVRRAASAGQSPQHPGGALVRLRGQEMLFLDPTAPATDQIDVVVEALRGRAELDELFLPPEIRELLEQGRCGR
jgi:hypothetical protein